MSNILDLKDAINVFNGIIQVIIGVPHVKEYLLDTL